MSRSIVMKALSFELSESHIVLFPHVVINNYEVDEVRGSNLGES